MPVPRSRLLPADITPAVSTKQIRIFHHGYTPRRLILQLFSCPLNPDGNLDDLSNYALPYDLVLEACALLANNKRGTLWLSSSSSKPRKVSATTRMLKPGEYMYRITGESHDYRYPLCRKFSNWTPVDVPKSWLFDGRVDDAHDLQPIDTSAGASAVVKFRDEVCVITRQNDRLDSAHLVPTAAARWFVTHGFNDTAGDTDYVTVNSPNNRVALRSDISARGLDAADFCFYPYQRQWVTLWMGNGSLHLAREYNFREVSLPPPPTRCIPLREVCMECFSSCRQSVQTPRDDSQIRGQQRR
ncbi:hypothetical protein B0H11DRAFT_427939 [Mycena galericulata]|nr:hypothetical protein B0H11DRAFT_427939 [Mycena galericulata]